ncbi:acyltransferase [Ramlibacter sp.]|uniref:acyltransferase n=1 Tax=Ramlibacter sp. TaxID=1917967 RepID=UPI0017DC08E2|nr:acyltransferase [Ramlibacter sp.]MBA2673577.1 acyltransferase [Ramlibacter sp.]
MSRFASLIPLLRGVLWTRRSGVQAKNRPRIMGPRCRLDVQPGGQLRIGVNLVVDRDVEIVVYPGGVLELGDNVYIGHGSTVACAQSIRIGNDTIIGDLVSIRDMNHLRQPGVPLRASGIRTQPIRIGANCWLGSKVTVTAGAALGDESTAAANAVVTGTFDAASVVGGVPARPIAGREAQS